MNSPSSTVCWIWNTTLANNSFWLKRPIIETKLVVSFLKLHMQKKIPILLQSIFTWRKTSSTFELFLGITFKHTYFICKITFWTNFLIFNTQMYRREPEVAFLLTHEITSLETPETPRLKHFLEITFLNL